MVKVRAIDDSGIISPVFNWFTVMNFISFNPATYMMICISTIPCSLHHVRLSMGMLRCLTPSFN